jgi:ribosomal-protein-alanine N-acetyltransferase
MRSAMPARSASTPSRIRLRPGTRADLDDLVDLEARLFDYDVVSRASFRRFLQSRTAVLIVGEHDGAFAGYVLVLFRSRSHIARLYSIAVARESAGLGLGPKLLAAAEEVARRRGCTIMRLEVHDRNAAAIRRYRKSGYLLSGRRPGYYDDGSNALTFEKELPTPSTRRKVPLRRPAAGGRPKIAVSKPQS